MNTPEASLMDLAYQERRDLAGFLQTLTPQDWETESLCAGWTVKDVVAHIISYEELNFFAVATRIIKGRFVHANDIGVAHFAHKTPDELLDFLNRHLHPQGLTAGFGGMIALVDGTIHHQDIRRAVSKPRTIPPDRLSRILPRVPGNPRLGAGRRIRGLHLQATDIDWNHGRHDHPTVTGTGESLLMAITGRRSALDELTGPGAAILTKRVK